MVIQTPSQTHNTPPDSQKWNTLGGTKRGPYFLMDTSDELYITALIHGLQHYGCQPHHSTRTLPFRVVKNPNFHLRDSLPNTSCLKKSTRIVQMSF
jgi:hypothetical protein